MIFSLMTTTLKAYSAAVLPFPSIIIPLSVYFAATNDQDTHPSAAAQGKLERWIWRAFFSRRYSKRLEQLNHDIKEIIRLKNAQPDQLGEFSVDLDEDFFSKTQFNLNTANTKTFVLMLANEGPLNFFNGSAVSIEPVLRNCNKKEFHHVFPRKFLLENRVQNKDINMITNFVVLAKADNNKLGGVAPSAYRKIMPDSNESVRLILSRAICPDDIFHDDYARFVSERNKRLVEKAYRLMGLANKKIQPTIVLAANFGVATEAE